MIRNRQMLPRPMSQKAEPTNIRLEPALKLQAAQVAVDRYDWSLTKLIRTLLQKEIAHKGGMVNAKFRS